MGEVNEQSVESILKEIGIKNPDFSYLENALIKSKQNFVDAQFAVDTAQRALDEAKKEPNVMDLARAKIEGMLQLDFDQQAIVDALKLQYSKNKTKDYRNEGDLLDDKVKQEITEYILNLTCKFKTTDIWEKFFSYKRSDIYGNIIAPLVKEKKIVKRGEKRGVYYCVADKILEENIT